MSFKNCPSPEYDKYKIGESFDGSLIYIASPAKGHVYCINHETFEEFNQIEEFQPTNAFKIPPGFGTTFIWYDKVRKSSYRAYRLNSSSADAMSVKSFLFDIGEIKYEKFSPSKYFEIPINFLRIPPLGLCCIVDSYPKPSADSSKADFLNESQIGKSCRFTIQSKTVIMNSLAAEEKCMVVNIESSGEETDEEPVELQVVQLPPRNMDHFRELTYSSDSTAKHVPFLIDQIPKITDWPQPGSKIMVHLTEVGSHPSSVHARCSTQESFVEEKLMSDFMPLMMWMNQPEVFKKYQKLEVAPIINEVILVEEKNCRIHRAVVKNGQGIFFQVFLFDIGKTLTVLRDKLYKFPLEFATMPAQAIRLRVSNMESLSDELRSDAIETIQSCSDSIRMAHVIDSLQDELLVKLYDYDGTDVLELMQIRIRNQLAENDN